MGKARCMGAGAVCETVGMGSAQGILNTKGGGHRSPNARISVFRVAFRAPAFGPLCVTAGCMHAGVVYETEGGQEVESGVVRNAGGSRRPKYAHRA